MCLRVGKATWASILTTGYFHNQARDFTQVELHELSSWKRILRPATIRLEIGQAGKPPRLLARSSDPTASVLANYIIDPTYAVHGYKGGDTSLLFFAHDWKGTELLVPTWFFATFPSAETARHFATTYTSAALLAAESDPKRAEEPKVTAVSCR